MPQKKTHPRNPLQSSASPTVVSPAWLAKSLTLLILAAALCIYLTLCLLFYQGQWQLVFRPSHTIDNTPASIGLNFASVSFDATETGRLQLTGWFIPADLAAKYANTTALICHDNIGSLANSLATIQQLHTLGMNVFVFDYRAFGNSDWIRPSEHTWYADTEAAYHYLTDARHIPAQQIVLYGIGLGATAAAHLASQNPVSALIAVNPVSSGRMLVNNDPRARFIPLSIFFSNHFEWSAVPNTAPTLFIEDTGISCPALGSAFTPAACYGRESAHHLFTKSRAPKIFSEFKSSIADNDQTLSRFLDEYLPAK